MPDVNWLFVQPNLPMCIVRICGILRQDSKSHAVVDVVDILTLRSHSDETQEHEEHKKNKFAPHPAPPHSTANSAGNEEEEKSIFALVPQVLSAIPTEP
jgi:hypothetical protein